MKDWKPYEHVKQIGRGSHGRVFKAYDPVHDRWVAIKEAVKREKDARHEAMVMKSYGSSPFLPELYDSFAYDGSSFIVMEYVEGHPVGKGDFHREAEKREEEWSVQVTIHVLEALAAIHESGYIHYDVRPKNIMIKGEDPATVKVIDFTLAKRISERFTVGRDLQDAARLCVFLIHGCLPDSLDNVEFRNERVRTTLESILENKDPLPYSSARGMIEALKEE
ncbi:serine/threonine protein kinase [Salimicrobium halophilum]|uniref:Protein kinase domain-containing protein n=1 Tax=Salimicrobium halophilum TaxID=86666 RepID=A0A1G8UH18_9BACI|nr:protein kinase [Salimicrobium halophilum]SDJ53113.1 Protein kinase domain-containing protein [Salimicrobium halophilum]